MQKIVRKILVIENWLTHVETWSLAAIFFTMLLISCVQVFLRKFGSAMGWADEFNQNMVIYVGMFGAILAIKEGRHLTMDILTNFLPDKFKPYISFVVYLFVLLVVSILFRFSWMYMQYRIEFESHDMLFPWLSKSTLSVIFPLSFGLMFVHYIFRILSLFSGEKPAGSDQPKVH